MLSSLFGLPVSVTVIAEIPIWSQYVDLLEWALDGLAGVFNNAGIAVIVFTILVKTLLMPLTVQALRSSKAMQELQPKVQELRKKHGKDRQRLSQETMRLYAEHHVNPAAGCFPMLIQIPIFFGLYQAILHLSNSDVGVWGEGFLWIDSLADDDPLHVLPILAGVFQFIQTKMMRPANQGKITDPQQAMMNSMMNIMPLMVVVFGWAFPAGPVLYWVAQSAYSVVQQWFITGWGSLRDWLPGLPELPEHRRLGYRPPRSPEDMVVVSGGEDGATRPAGVMGWLQRRMEEAEQQAGARVRSGTQDDVAATVRPNRETRATRPTAARAGSRRRKKAQGSATVEAPANGKAERVATNGTTRPVVVPRKSRPSRKGTGADAS